MDERNDFINRIGTFFVLLGTFLMVVFVATDLAQQANFSFFFSSIPLLFLGWYFKHISAPPPAQSSAQRFAWLRKMMQKQKEAKAKREAKKQQGKR